MSDESSLANMLVSFESVFLESAIIDNMCAFLVFGICDDLAAVLILGIPTYTGLTATLHTWFGEMTSR